VARTPDSANAGGTVQVVTSPVATAPFRGQRLCSDGTRSVVAIAAAAGLTLVLAVALMLTGPPGGEWPAAMLVLGLVCWTLFTILYVAMTERIFNHTDADEFAARMAARTALRSRHWKRLHTKAGPTFAVCASIVAFAVVLVLPHVEGVEIDDTLLVPLSVGILFSCWGVSIISYALHTPSTTSPSRRSTSPAGERTRSRTTSTSRSRSRRRSGRRTSPSTLPR
jgi:hypothetical protein